MRQDKFDYIESSDLTLDLQRISEITGIFFVRQLIRENITGGMYVPTFNHISGAVERLIQDARKIGLSDKEISIKYHISSSTIKKVPK